MSPTVLIQKKQGVSVKEILRLPILKDAKIVSGIEGLDRIVCSIDNMEVPEIKPRHREGEIFLIMTDPIHHEPSLLTQLVEDLAQVGAAALVFKQGRFVQEIPNAMIEASNRFQLPVITIPVDTPFIDITNAVTELVLNWQMALLSRAEEIGTKLTNMVLENKGIQVLADNVSDILNAAISIFDYNGNEIVQVPKKSSKLTGYTNYDILVNEQVAGKLIVYKESLDAMEQVCVNQARVVFSLELMRMKTAEQTEMTLKGNFIDEILSELPPSELEVQKKGRQLDFDPDKLWEIAIIEGIDDNSDGPIYSELKTLLISESQRKSLRPHLERRGAQVLLLLPSQERKDTFWLDLLRVWVDQHLGEDKARIHIGMGTKFPLWNVYQSYLEARKALEITLKTYAQTCFVPYEDLEVYKVLADVAKDKDLSDLFQRKLGNLLSYDQDTRSELLKTLYVYLELGRNIQETAKKLYIHRNSVKYRLDRIEEIAQLDLSSAHQCFIYHLLITWYLLK